MLICRIGGDSNGNGSHCIMPCFGITHCCIRAAPPTRWRWAPELQREHGIVCLGPFRFSLSAKLLLRVLRRRSCGRSGRVTAKLKALLTNTLWPLGAFEVFTDGSLRHLQKPTERNISEPQAAASAASHAHQRSHDFEHAS